MILLKKCILFKTVTKLQFFNRPPFYSFSITISTVGICNLTKPLIIHLKTKQNYQRIIKRFLVCSRNDFLLKMALHYNRMTVGLQINDLTKSFSCMI